MQFNRQIFYTNYKSAFGRITQQQVDGLNKLLDFIEADVYLEDQIEWIAYILATVRIETAYTYHPIHEYGSKRYFIRRYGGQTRKGRELGNDTPEEGYDYAGKGYAQVTGESNYEKAETALRRYYPELVARFEERTGKRFDLTVGDQPGDKRDPQNIMDAEIAFAVMSYGMRTGLFTTRKLAHYIRPGKKDYVNARRIINGTDRAREIAGIAEKFESILRASSVSTDYNAVEPEIEEFYGASNVNSQIEPVADETISAETRSSGDINQISKMETGGRKTSEFWATNIVNTIIGVLTFKFAFLSDPSVANTIASVVLPTVSAGVTMFYNAGRKHIKSQLIQSALDTADSYAKAKQN